MYDHQFPGTWDMQFVLNFLEEAWDPVKASLKALTHRTAFLMAITCNINRMKVHSNDVAFVRQS